MDYYPLAHLPVSSAINLGIIWGGNFDKYSEIYWDVYLTSIDPKLIAADRSEGYLIKDEISELIGVKGI